VFRAGWQSYTKHTDLRKVAYLGRPTRLAGP
jgi:hypothetical protein